MAHPLQLSSTRMLLSVRGISSLKPSLLSSGTLAIAFSEVRTGFFSIVYIGVMAKLNSALRSWCLPRLLAEILSQTSEIITLLLRSMTSELFSIGTGMWS